MKLEITNIDGFVLNAEVKTWVLLLVLVAAALRVAVGA